MRRWSFSAVALDARLALARFGWGNLAVGTLCVASTATYLWMIPHLRNDNTRLQQSLTQIMQKAVAAHTAVVATPRSLNEERLDTFHDTLGEKRYEEQQLKALFAIAGKTGLSLEQAEYKSAYDKAGSYHTYQIVLPVKGTYSAIRQFCEQVLLTIPFASLDQLNFKRDAIGNNIVEAQLRFTLYLADPAATAKDIVVAEHVGAP